MFKEPALRFSVSQNTRGFRDPERSLEKPEDVVRILCVGDSFTWGWGVEQDSIYTHILEDRLLGEGRRAEVINTGVCGYSTDQTLLFLEKEGFGYSPDLVVCQATSNDVLGNTRGLSEGKYRKPFFELAGAGALSLCGHPVPRPGFARRLESSICRHSRLGHLLKRRMGMLRLRLGPRTAQSRTWGLATDEDGADYPLRLFCALVCRMNRECRERGVRLAVLLDFPLRPDQLEYWRRNCGSVETHFLAPHLRRLEERYNTPAAIPGDGHWTAEGHEWVADFLHDHVLLSISPAL
jgi:hypothetical protein